MSRKKRLQQKKHLYRDTQEIARHVIHDPKRRRARFMYQIKDLSRKTNIGYTVAMTAAQYLYSVDAAVGRIVGINREFTSWERLNVAVSCREHE